MRAPIVTILFLSEVANPALVGQPTAGCQNCAYCLNSVQGLLWFVGITLLVVIGLVAWMIALARNKKIDDLKTAVDEIQKTVEQTGKSDAISDALARLASGLPPPYAPKITSIVHTHHHSDMVEIHGRNFSTDCVVRFGSIDAHPEAGSTANVIHVRIPPGQSGDVDVCVESPNRVVSASCPFTYPKRTEPPEG